MPKPAKRVKQPPVYPYVEVRWLDAQQVGGDWLDLSDAKAQKCAPSVSVGMLLFEDAERLVVCSLVNTNNHAGLCLVIPQGMVQQMTHLTAKDPDV